MEEEKNETELVENESSMIAQVKTWIDLMLKKSRETWSSLVAAITGKQNSIAEARTSNEEEVENKNEEETVETEIERAQKKRREALFEMSLFFILGVLIGITLKTEAVKRVTMGFNDYQIKKSASYDVDAIKKEFEDQAKAQQQAAEQRTQTQVGPQN